MESNVLTLKVLVRKDVLILINSSALPLATSKLMLPGGGFNTRSSLSIRRILCRDLSPGTALLSCHLSDCCVEVMAQLLHYRNTQLARVSDSYRCQCKIDSPPVHRAIMYLLP